MVFFALQICWIDVVPQKVPQHGNTKEDEVYSHLAPQNQPYYLVPRRGKRKKTVYYHRIIDQDRRVVGEWSTHCTRKQDAFRYCEHLLHENQLVPTLKHRASPKNPSLFKDYYADWFDWPMGQEEPNCPYIKKRLKRGKRYSPSNTQIQRRDLTKYLLPAFGNRPKNLITPTEIEDWLYSLSDDTGISARTANNKFDLLRTMLTEAHRLGHISTNPRIDNLIGQNHNCT